MVVLSMMNSLMLIPLMSNKFSYKKLMIVTKMTMMMVFMNMMFMHNTTDSLVTIKSSMMGVDKLSLLLMMLSLWIGYCMMLSSNKWMKMSYKSEYMFIVILMMNLLILNFMVQSFMYFYLMFEMILIPMVILIMGWGYQPERIEAGLYLMVYTIIGSIPLLLMLVFMKVMWFSMSMNYLIYFENSMTKSVWVSMMFIMGIMGFMVKMPMYWFHLWLPKAHVEAPLSGSMILAGVLLKLGGYGLYRLIILYKDELMSLNLYLMMWGLMGSLMASVICINQVDMKCLVAYSSVVHMSVMFSGVMNLSSLGIYGGVILMLGHGLCSSGLFCIVNMMYERSNSRSLMINKGYKNLFPMMSIWCFLFIVNNFACPPSMNLVGELSLVGSILSFNLMMMVFLFMISMLSSMYSIMLYLNSQHGEPVMIFNYKLLNLREHLMLLMHFLPMNLFILKSDLFYTI